MTRASRLALAVVTAMCWLGTTPTYAQQSGPPVYSGAPGYYVLPGEPPPRDAFGDPNAVPGAAQEPWYGNSEQAAPLPKMRKQARISGGFFRTEYLNWSISGPGDQLMGAPIAGNSDPTQPFNAFDSAGNFLGVATVPSTHDFTFNDKNGLRGTLGFDFVSGGSVEVSAFTLENAKAGRETDNLLGTNQLVATSTLVNGVVSNNLETYNTSFQSLYTSRLWGAEANYFVDYDTDGLVQFRPLAGVRFMSLSETLTQHGVFTDTTQLIPVQTVTDINSQAQNNLFGPQAGFRSEIVTDYFVIGVEPKIALTANSIYNTVSTNHFRSNSDPLTTTQDSYTGFSPIIDVGCYTRVKITHNINFTIGYNFIWVGLLSRPATNIYYNDTGASNPPGVVVQTTRHDVTLGGLSIGAEWKF